MNGKDGMRERRINQQQVDGSGTNALLECVESADWKDPCKVVVETSEESQA